jgi:ribosome maturation factor RimP
MNAAQIETIINPLLDQESVELVDLEWIPEGPKWLLRLYLDKDGGITLDECGYLSERIGSWLDTQNAIDRPYILEISSPGMDRVIKKEKDFLRFTGKTVLVKLKFPQEGQRNFHGVLRGLENGKINVDCDGRPQSFERAIVDEVRLDDTAGI